MPQVTKRSARPRAMAFEPGLRHEDPLLLLQRPLNPRSDSKDGRRARLLDLWLPFSLAMGSLLCPIATDRHAAPSLRLPPRSVKKEQCAGGSFASLDAREIVVAYEVRHRSGDWQQKGVGARPSACGTPHEGRVRPTFTLSPDDLSVFLVAFQNMVQGAPVPSVLRSEAAYPCVAERRRGTIP
jgi:hypothetical protein